MTKSSGVLVDRCSSSAKRKNCLQVGKGRIANQFPQLDVTSMSRANMALPTRLKHSLNHNTILVT